MRHAVLLAALVTALLAACAQTPPKPSEGTPDTQSLRNRARVHAELGAAYYSAGRYSVAIDELQESLKSDPQYVPAINQLALVYLAIGQEPKAIAELQRALKIDPNDSSVNNNYGTILCQRGKVKEGLQHLQKTLADPLYPSPAAAHVNAGICLKNAGEPTQAEAMFRKALALSPEQPQALYQLAEIAYARGDLVAARDFINRRAKATEPDLEALWLAARIESRLGDRNALASYGAQLNRRFPDAAQTRAFNEGRFQ